MAKGQNRSKNSGNRIFHRKMMETSCFLEKMLEKWGKMAGKILEMCCSMERRWKGVEFFGENGENQSVLGENGRNGSKPQENAGKGIFHRKMMESSNCLEKMLEKWGKTTGEMLEIGCWLEKCWKWAMFWGKMVKIGQSLEKMVEMGQTCRKNAGNGSFHRKMLEIGCFLRKMLEVGRICRKNAGK